MFLNQCYVLTDGPVPAAAGHPLGQPSPGVPDPFGQVNNMNQGPRPPGLGGLMQGLTQNRPNNNTSAVSVSIELSISFTEN